MSVSKCFIIAELSANHGGDIKIAKETIRAAKSAGADAIKLQTYTADSITLNARNNFFKIAQNTLWDGQYLYDLYKEAALPWEWHHELFKVAAEEGILCFSSPFDNNAVDFLEQFNPPYYKIASFEINDIPLIKYTAEKGRPMIISTGMGNETEIEQAVNVCRSVGNNEITLLKCTSSYPAPLDASNLKSLQLLKDRFGVSVGLSDHTEGFIAPVVAVSLGASVIEKHFILDRSIRGADASFSMEPKEFKQMVDQVRLAESSLGQANFNIPKQSEANQKFKRSLFISQDIKKGECFSKLNVKSVRPSDGISPQYFEAVMDRKAKHDLYFGNPLKLSDVENGEELVTGQ